jgi:hypothetical protein
VERAEPAGDSSSVPVATRPDALSAASPEGGTHPPSVPGERRGWARARVALGTVLSLALVAGGYLYATAVMSSLYDYRSPFAAEPLRGGSSLGPASTGRVVLVLVDGLRTDIAANATTMPYLAELRTRGASATVRSGLPSYSAPSWTVLLTGATPDLSDGPALNPTEPAKAPAWTQDSVFATVKAAGRTTAVVGTDWFDPLVPKPDVSTSYFVHDENDAADQASTDAAIGIIGRDEAQFLLVHLNEVDHTSHYDGGPLSAAGLAAATGADNRLRAIGGALDFTADTIVVVSDHGHLDVGGHGGPEDIVLQEPLVMAGAGIQAGAYGDVRQVDIAPTLSALLGARIPAVSQGRVLTQMLRLDAATAAALPAAVTAQQGQLLQRYATAIGRPLPVVDASQASADPVGAYQGALDGIRGDRLRGEQLPRLGIVVLALLAGLVLLVRFVRATGGRRFLGYGVAAVAYGAAFHAYYVYLQRRTYSLSSVRSSTDLIVTVAIGAAVSLVLAWLIAVVFTRGLRQAPAVTVSRHYGFIFFLIGLLALPVAATYLINGPLVSWTLPDFRVMFPGFLAVLHILVVAAVGLLLAGVSALWSSRVTRKRAGGPSAPPLPPA